MICSCVNLDRFIIRLPSTDSSSGRGHPRGQGQQQHAKLNRQIRNLLELIKDGHGGAAMAAELRDLERRQDDLARQIGLTGVPEPVPVLHPSLPDLYRRRVEALEHALGDPATAMAATEALRKLIDAILVFPGDRRGEVSVSFRGDLAAFLHAAELPEGTALAVIGAANSKKAAPVWVSGLVGRKLLSLDAGTGFEPVTFRL